MVDAKNYETVSTFVTVMQRKLWNCGLFFPDKVYIVKWVTLIGHRI